MRVDYEAFIKGWDGHVNRLIKVSAKKADRIEEKHQQIVNGALGVFLKKGYHPTTIREIAEAAGMSLGQLYHYVSSKDDVLFLIHRHQQISFFRHMAKMVSADDDDAVDILVKSLHHAIPFLAAHDKLFRFIIGESKYLNKEHLKVVLQMDDQNIVQYWRQLLQLIKEQRGIDIDIDFCANLITYMAIFFPMRQWNLKSHSADRQQELLVNSILAAIGLKTPDHHPNGADSVEHH